jgi:hypothetical protein
VPSWSCLLLAEEVNALAANKGLCLAADGGEDDPGDEGGDELAAPPVSGAIN